ncbi:MAG: hypothetical protein GXP31_00315 [Kiritimatiellaeota bacterium]|nr:hypothetical protein [Kiritimatiellota bacterium]
MKKSLGQLVLLLVACGTNSPGAGAAPSPAGHIDLQPPPKHAEMGADSAPLPQAVILETRGESVPEIEYALADLARELKTRFGRKVALRQSLRPERADPAEPAATIILETAPGIHTPPEGYELRIERRDNTAVVAIRGVDPSGVLYGTFAFRDLLEQAGTAPLPCPIFIRDWPTLATRAYTGFARDLSDRSRRTLDRLARCRINAGYYEIYADRGQDVVPPEVAKLAREAAKRGITLYGCVSNWRTNRYLKRPLCASNPDDVALVERWFEALAQRGCTGLIFLFDDIRPDAVVHTETCTACRTSFGDLAGTQAFWLEVMARVAERRRVRRLLTCPTPYYRGWQNTAGGKLDGIAYFARLGPVCERLGIDMYFCPYRSSAVAEAVTAGLRRFVWWYNGVYSMERALRGVQLDPGMWPGFPQLEFGWYNTHPDAERGLAIDADVRNELRTLPARTRAAWLCGGGDVPWMLWGIYTWAPTQYDAKSARRAAVIAALGTWKPYDRWERIVRKWIGVFAGAKAGQRWRDPAKRTAVLDELERDIATAEQAVRKAALPVRALLDAKTTRECTRRMNESLEALRDRLRQGRTGRVKVYLGPVKERSAPAGKRFDQKMSLSSFAFGYRMRYSIEGTVGKWRRCRYHFGSGLGMKGPSLRNWYDAGFIDVIVGGKSLDTIRAKFDKEDDTHLRGTWDGETATVVLRFSLRVDNGLEIRGAVRPKKTKVGPVAVKLWCIPGAGWGSWKDMDKWIATAQREVQHSRMVRLKLPKENWVVYYDKTYDIPREHAEGPCGLLFAPEKFANATINLATYVVETTLLLKPGADAFALTLWDFHGAKNADIVRAWRTSPPQQPQQ